jgi:ketosteroid isomerase-like protein
MRLNILRMGILMFVLGGCAHAPPASAPPQVAALRQISEAWNHSPATRDSDVVAQFFAPNIVVMSPQGRAPVRGIGANRAAWARFFRGVNPVHTMTTDTVVVGSGRDLGYVIGHWTVGVDTPGGRAEAAGQYLAVWQRLGGDWKMVAVSAYPFR